MTKDEVVALKKNWRQVRGHLASVRGSVNEVLDTLDVTLLPDVLEEVRDEVDALERLMSGAVREAARQKRIAAYVEETASSHLLDCAVRVAMPCDCRERVEATGTVTSLTYGEAAAVASGDPAVIEAAMYRAMSDEELLSAMRLPLPFDPKVNRAVLMTAELQRRGLESK